MRTLIVVCSLLLGAPSTRIKGGSTSVREAFASLGVGDASYEEAEVWIEKKFAVMLSKSPGLCDPDLEPILARNPAFWAYWLRILNLSLPSNSGQKSLLRQQRILMLVQWPGGSSCGWRLLEPGGDWESVQEMKRTTSLGSCGDAIDVIAKLGASESAVSEIKASLAHPSSRSDCHRPDGGP